MEPPDSYVLIAATSKLAAATLLAQEWPLEGKRQDTALALSRVLLDAHWNAEDAASFIVAVAEAAGDEEACKRGQTVEHTAAKLEVGAAATGIPSLGKLIGEAVVKKVLGWLQIKATPQRTPRGFTVRGGSTYAVRAQGEELIANFTARIAKQVERGHELIFHIEADIAGVKRKVVVPAADYPSMEWVASHLGAGAVIQPRKKDEMRAAIQMLSEDCRTVRGSEYTGWHEFVGGWGFVTNAGVLGVDQELEVELPTALSRIKLSKRAGGHDAIERFLTNLPPKLSLPLLAAVARTVVGACQLNIELVGLRGTFKTEVAKLVQSYFGALQETDGLPGSWSSTANSNELLLHHGKDIVVVVDDFNRAGSQFDQEAGERDRDRVMRGNFNGQGRSRLTRDGKLLDGRPPQCTVLSTAERMPMKASLLDRQFILEVFPGDIESARLTICQRDARGGEYAAFLSGFIQWLAPQREQLHREALLREAELRDELLKGSSVARSSSIEAKLVAGMEILDRYLEHAGRKGHTQELRQALELTRPSRSDNIQEADPVDAFKKYLEQALASGAAHVASTDGGCPALKPGQYTMLGWRGSTGVGDQPMGQRIGFVDEDGLYLLPEATLEAVRKCAGAANCQIPAKRQLSTELERRKILLGADTGRGNTKRISFGSGRVATWKLPLNWILPDVTAPTGGRGAQ